MCLISVRWVSCAILQIQNSPEAHLKFHGLQYGLRNRIVHDYDGVNLQLVWEIISEDIPVLRDTLLKLI